MALPEQVINKLSRESAPTPGWSGRLLFLSSIVFGASIAVYLGFVFAWKPYLVSKVAGLRHDIQAFTSQVAASDQGKLAAFYSELANIKSLLAKHIVVSPLFTWLEKNTDQNTYFTKFEFTGTTNQLILTGEARTSGDVADQIAIFESQPEVKTATLRTMAQGQTGLWDFEAALTFNPSFLKVATK